jgi:2-polyprenyl-6-methoxyphenol hydroxylase-like FAD-dependent oxidoreductase
MRLNGCEVAVVGAGIGGLAAGLALAQRGAQVTVLERAGALTEVGTGIQVGPNGVAVLEALGLRDDAERLASVPGAILLREHRSGSVVARVPLGHDCVARYGRPYWQFHRADLLGLLSQAAAEAGVTLRLGTEVRVVEPGPAGVRIVTATEELAAAVAVGADGVRSCLRQARFTGTPPRFTGHVAWRGLVPAMALPAALRRNATSVWMGPGRHLVAYPLRGGRLVNFVAVEERKDWEEEGWTHPDARSTQTGTWSEGFSQPRTSGVDADVGQAVGRLGRQEEVVDPDAVVLLPGAGLVVPEGVDPRIAVEDPHRVGQPEVDHPPVGLPGVARKSASLAQTRGSKQSSPWGITLKSPATTAQASSAISAATRACSRSIQASL